MTIKVSIILPIFNGEDWIDESIKSILNQDYKYFELLIVNDGSYDSSEQKIMQYIKLDKRIKYLPKKHSGLTDSLNYALKKATGEWIARIDVDDISTKSRLSKQVRYIQYKKNLVLIGSNFSIKKNNLIIYNSDLPNNNKKLIYRLKNMKGFFPHSSAFFSKDKAIKVGGYRKAFIKSQDHDLWLRLSEIGEIGCINDKLVEINEHEDRISNSKSGFSQTVYAFAALVAYNLRSRKNFFLERKINSNKIFDLLEELNKYLDCSNFYKVEKLKQKTKKLFSLGLSFSLIKELLNLFLSNKYLFFLLLKRSIFGCTLPHDFSKRYEISNN